MERGALPFKFVLLAINFIILFVRLHIGYKGLRVLAKSVHTVQNSPGGMSIVDKQLAVGVMAVGAAKALQPLYKRGLGCAVARMHAAGIKEGTKLIGGQGRRPRARV